MADAVCPSCVLETKGAFAMPVTYEKTDDPRAPAIVRVNGRETPVWIQRLWEEGPYA